MADWWDRAKDAVIAADEDEDDDEEDDDEDENEDAEDNEDADEEGEEEDDELTISVCHRSTSTRDDAIAKAAIAVWTQRAAAKMLRVNRAWIAAVATDDDDDEEECGFEARNATGMRRTSESAAVAAAANNACMASAGA